MFDAFKELLLRKSDLFKDIPSELLDSIIKDRLEKAEQNNRNNSKNQAAIHFASTILPMEGEMMHDAYSHHVSRFKAAKESDNQDLANQHAHQAMRILHVANKSHSISNEKIRIGHADKDGNHKDRFIDVKPWERHAYTNTNDSGKYTTDTQGFGRAMRSKPQFWSILSQSPHAHGMKEGDGSYHKQIKVHGHNEAYPFEANKIQDKFPHIENIESPESYEEHPFDNHPIFNVIQSPGHKRNIEDDEKYFKDQQKFREDHLEPFIQGMRNKHEQDPDAFHSRGIVQSDPVHQSSTPPLEGDTVGLSSSSSALDSIDAQHLDPEMQALLASLKGGK